jgi:hypothetical protein
VKFQLELIRKSQQEKRMSLAEIKKNLSLTIIVISMLLALLAAILLHAYMGSFSRYIADDYCTAGTLKAFGFFESQNVRHLTWDGRYSFTFFIMLFSMFGQKFASFLPSISIGLWLASSFYFFKQIAKKIISRPDNLSVLLVTSMFSFLVLYTIPQIGEDVYWMTGISTYLFPIILEFFMLGFLIKVFPTIDKRRLSTRILYSVTFLFLSFLNSGFSEVSTALHVAIIGIILVIGIISAGQKKMHFGKLVYLILLFLGAVLGFVYMATAPGNNIRMNPLAQHPGFFELTLNSVLLGGKYLVNWFLDHSNLIWPVSIILAIFGFYFPSFSTIRTEFSFKTVRKIFLIYLLCSFLLVIASFVPTYWTGFTIPPDRVLILPITILCGVVISTSFLLGIVMKHEFKNILIQSKIQNVVLFIICTYFVLSIPFTQARSFYQKNINTQRGFAQKWDQINNAILSDISNGQEYLLAESVAYNFMDLERIYPEPDFWINKCVASYYQVKEIIAK